VLPGPERAVPIQRHTSALAFLKRHAEIDVSWLNDEDALKIVRLGLFDLGKSLEAMTEEQIEQVQARLLAVLNPHLTDDTDTFNKWFFENIDNLVHSIAKKKRPGGPIPREMVRQCLLETVFRCYRYTGHCVHALMWDFLQAMPEKLNPKERAIFDPLYLSQPFLGGLPFIFLRDRFDLLREAILDIFDNPQDPQPRGILLRLLQYYGEMTSKKRQGDRSYKKQHHHRNNQNRSAAEFTFDDKFDQATEAGPDWFQDITAHLRELRMAKCQCKTTDRWRAELKEGKPTSKRFLVREECERCGHSEEHSFTPAQFKASRKNLTGDGNR
jgi:hypothetical protein